jgi:hypothetical protein
MNRLRDPVGEEMALLEGVLARKGEKEKIDLLTTSTRAALVRQQAAFAESSALRRELRRVEALFAEASQRNEASLSAYRASLDRALAETRAQCEQRLRDMSEELEKAKTALGAAEEDRDLLFATILQHVMTVPPIPLLKETVESHPEGPASEGSNGVLFRDDAQACAAIGVLLGAAGLERLWTCTGPTPDADLLTVGEGVALSAGEWLLLRAAYDLWNGKGGLAFAEVARGLSGEPARMLFTLTTAVSTSPTAVDHWLSEHGAERSAFRNQGAGGRQPPNRGV